MRRPRPLPQLVGSHVVNLRVSGRVRMQTEGTRSKIVGLRVQHRVNGDVVDHGVVDLAADAWSGDLVQLAQALPASAQILHFRLGYLPKLRLANVLPRLVAAIRSPSEKCEKNVSGECKVLGPVTLRWILGIYKKRTLVDRATEATSISKW